jgi:hypothetical protein
MVHWQKVLQMKRIPCCLINLMLQVKQLQIFLLEVTLSLMDWMFAQRGVATTMGKISILKNWFR